VTSTALSTTARTLSPKTRFAHSTSRSSSHTLAIILSTLISTPGTGIPILCNLSISSLCSALRSSSSEPSDAPSSPDSFFTVEGDAGTSIAPFLWSLGIAIGTQFSAPNCASRNMKSRSSRSVGDKFACGLRVGSAWEWECLLEDSERY
jgi:hypothetical protein